MHRCLVVTSPSRPRTPAQCKLCGAVGTVVPETTIIARAVRMTWCCRACRGEWPVAPSEEQLFERRSDRPDRRRVARGDRRTD